MNIICIFHQELDSEAFQSTTWAPVVSIIITFLVLLLITMFININYFFLSKNEVSQINVHEVHTINKLKFRTTQPKKKPDRPAKGLKSLTTQQN